MVKELHVKKPSTTRTTNRSTSTKPQGWKTTARQTLLLLHVFGLGMVTQYMWTTRGDRVSLSTIAARNKQYNRAVAAIDVHSNQTHNRSESTVAVAVAEEPPIQIPIQNMSRLEYNACCGLGHRLNRQAAAYHAAHKLGFKLDVNWPQCSTNVFDELFFPETEQDLAYVNSTHERYTVDNEVHGYFNAHKNCLPEELRSNYEMYAGLKRRFRHKESIDQFIKEHFEHHFAIGIHIRAGNGEGGDFTDKKRQVTISAHNYTHRVSQHIMDAIHRSNNTLPPVLFVATDTAEYVHMFRSVLGNAVPVIDWHQEHEAAGSGVFMGQWQKQSSKDECLQKWNDMWYDMILLASTDLLIAGHFSSFSQAMPMSLVMGSDPEAQGGPNKMCEVYQEGLDMECFSNKMQWCKKTKFDNSLKTLNVNGGMWPTFLEKMNASPKYIKKTGR